MSWCHPMLILFQLPKLDMTLIKTREEKLLTHKVLTFLGSKYCWQDGFRTPIIVSCPSLSLPPSNDILVSHHFVLYIQAFIAYLYSQEVPSAIAKPLIEVSLDLGCQPILSIFDLLYYNLIPEKSHYLRKPYVLH